MTQPTYAADLGAQQALHRHCTACGAQPGQPCTVPLPGAGSICPNRLFRPGDDLPGDEDET